MASVTLLYRECGPAQFLLPFACSVQDMRALRSPRRRLERQQIVGETPVLRNVRATNGRDEYEQREIDGTVDVAAVAGLDVRRSLVLVV
eukprot:COSAG01_NODE_38291_length_491_cov_1.596939_2_plen_88_part_01